MEMGDRVLAETLLNQAPKIPSDLCDWWDYKTLAETTIEFQADINKAEDAYEPASAFYDMAISKIENLDQWNELFETEYKPLKMTILKNPNCPKELIKKVVEGDDTVLKQKLLKILPQELLIDMVKMENMTFDEKLSVVSNSFCSEDLLKIISDDKQNYSSSRLRKAVALHLNTPKEIVNKLLEDEYIWVREAAATNSALKKREITKILEETNKKYPSNPRTYTIKSSYGYGLVENLGGPVSIDDVIEAMLSDEESWHDYIYSEFYSYADSWHEHGPTNLIDTVVYPDGSEQEIYVDGKFNYEFRGEVKIGGDSLGVDHFFHIASSWEKWSTPRESPPIFTSPLNS
jgi:hypothetical protein